MDHVALLFGVNVGGVRVAMADLRALAEGLGWRNPRTYIASGNLLFSAEGAPADLARALEAALQQHYGRAIGVIVATAADIHAALAACPFAPEAGKHVHAFFLTAPTRIDAALYESLRTPEETLVLQDHLAWLHAPAGVGRSKLAEKLHKVIPGTGMTGRNLNTLHALAEMLDAEGPG